MKQLNLLKKQKKKINFDNDISKSYFETTKEKLLIILTNSGIEKFSPKILTSAINNLDCEIDLNTKITNDKSKHDLIYSILKPGYKLILSDKNKKIIKKAIVKVFEFE